jgi:hypothetical protein
MADQVCLLRVLAGARRAGLPRQSAALVAAAAARSGGALIKYG